METSRKNLRLMSLLLLVLSAISLIRVIVSAAISGFKVEYLPEGVTEDVVKGVFIVIFGFSILLLIPQVYIAIKGLKVANNPDSSKGYIIWAKVLLVLSIIAVLSSVANIAQSTDKTTGFMELIDIGLDVVIYFMFIKYATAVYKSV